MDDNGVQSLTLLLGQISGKLDGVLLEQRRVGRMVDEHDSRIIALERQVSRAIGLAAGAGAVAGVVITVVGILSNYLLGVLG